MRQEVRGQSHIHWCSLCICVSKAVALPSTDTVLQLFTVFQLFTVLLLLALVFWLLLPPFIMSKDLILQFKSPIQTQNYKSEMLNITISQLVLVRISSEQLLKI